MIAVLPSESSLPAWNQINNSWFSQKGPNEMGRERYEKTTQAAARVIATPSIWHGAQVHNAIVSRWRKLERSWQYMPSYFIEKKITDAVPKSICFICSQMEENQGPLCQPVCLSQSITRMRNICGHCQRDNQGMFMITEGERE